MPGASQIRPVLRRIRTQATRGVTVSPKCVDLIALWRHSVIVCCRTLAHRERLRAPQLVEVGIENK